MSLKTYMILESHQGVVNAWCKMERGYKQNFISNFTGLAVSTFFIDLIT